MISDLFGCSDGWLGNEVQTERKGQFQQLVCLMISDYKKEQISINQKIDSSSEVLSVLYCHL